MPPPSERFELLGGNWPWFFALFLLPDVALFAYSGSAHRVMPLTRDSEVIGSFGVVIPAAPSPGSMRYTVSPGPAVSSGAEGTTARKMSSGISPSQFFWKYSMVAAAGHRPRPDRFLRRCCRGHRCPSP